MSRQNPSRIASWLVASLLAPAVFSSPAAQAAPQKQTRPKVGTLRPFRITETTPQDHEVGVDLGVDVTATFNSNLDPASVDSTSFVAQTNFGGLLTGSLNVNGDTLTFDPSRDLFAGEQVRVITTANILNTEGAELSNPTQWAFTAGPIKPRCLIAFNDIGANLPGSVDGRVSWGDYDSDGDLDFLVTGSLTAAAIVYRNDNGVFTDINAGLQQVSLSNSSWGDYDNDGDLDILIAGQAGGLKSTKLYLNNDGSFIDTGANLVGTSDGDVAFGDYDNDGDLDILISGYNSSFAPQAQLYRNDNGVFSDIGAGLAGAADSNVAFGDYDLDGDLDILIAGFEIGVGITTKLYQNNQGTFSDVSAGLQGVFGGSVAWGDYDNDGDLDILLTGLSDTFDSLSIVYRNDDGNFIDINAGLFGASLSSGVWGDYDNDGDLDILLTGNDSGGTAKSEIYRNDNGTFTDIDAGLPGAAFSTPAWGDYNSDGTLDILMTGVANGSGIKVYENTDCFTLSSHTPAAQSIGVDVNTHVTANFTGNVDASSANSANFVAHSAFGSLTGTVSVVGSNVVLEPDRPLFTGERVQMIATDRLTGVDGSSLANPTQWGFTAGPVLSRCFGGFTEVANFGPLGSGTMSWGDYDNDGDLDILRCGETTFGGGRVTEIYRNDGVAFTNIGAGLIGISGRSIWGDYDNDGDLDILMSGAIPSNAPGAMVYRNDNGLFSDIGAGLLGIDGDIDWGDYDNDGDLDIIVNGYMLAELAPATRVYRNDNGTFVDIGAAIMDLRSGGVTWGDYDNDGDLDVLINGVTGPIGNSGEYRTLIYRNENGSFANIHAGLTGIAGGGAAWGDYDNDGDLDILISGSPVPSGIASIVYRNDNGIFTDIGANLLPTRQRSAVAWADYDNDGDLDITIAGDNSPNGLTTTVYRNDGGNFIDIGASLPGIYLGDVAWGDYDSDGDLDLLVSGRRSRHEAGSAMTIAERELGEA